MSRVFFAAVPLIAVLEVLFIMGHWHVTTRGKWAANTIGWATMSLLGCVGLWPLLALLWMTFPASVALPPATTAVFLMTILVLAYVGTAFAREHLLSKDRNLS